MRMTLLLSEEKKMKEKEEETRTATAATLDSFHLHADAVNKAEAKMGKTTASSKKTRKKDKTKLLIKSVPASKVFCIRSCLLLS